MAVQSIGRNIATSVASPSHAVPTSNNVVSPCVTRNPRRCCDPNRKLTGKLRYRIEILVRMSCNSEEEMLTGRRFLAGLRSSGLGSALEGERCLRNEVLDEERPVI